jgi:hypothetical protein
MVESYHKRLKSVAEFSIINWGILTHSTVPLYMLTCDCVDVVIVHLSQPSEEVSSINIIEIISSSSRDNYTGRNSKTHYSDELSE